MLFDYFVVVFSDQNEPKCNSLKDEFFLHKVFPSDIIQNQFPLFAYFKNFVRISILHVKSQFNFFLLIWFMDQKHSVSTFLAPSHLFARLFAIPPFYHLIFLFLSFAIVHSLHYLYGHTYVCPCVCGLSFSLSLFVCVRVGYSIWLWRSSFSLSFFHVLLHRLLHAFVIHHLIFFFPFLSLCSKFWVCTPTSSPTEHFALIPLQSDSFVSLALFGQQTIFGLIAFTFR